MTPINTTPSTLPLPLECEPASPAPSKVAPVGFPPPPAKEPQSPAALDTAFTQLLGRTATPEELAELHRVRQALNLHDNDALWLVLLVLHHYRQQIEHTVFASLKQAQATAKATVERAGQDYLKLLFPKLLTQATDRITAKALGFNGGTIITGVIVLVTLVVIGMGGSALLSYHLGERAGQQQCRPESKTASLPPPKGHGR